MKRMLSFALAALLAVGVLVLPGGAASSRFADVPDTHWAAPYIAYAVDQGYFVGTSGTTFSPDHTMTRAMLWTVLARMDGYTGTAGPNAPWYQDGRDWAMANGISDGTNPDADITREQLATMLYNYAKFIGMETNPNHRALEQFMDC